MLSSTILEARRCMPAAVQDLTSYFVAQPMAYNHPEPSGPISPQVTFPAAERPSSDLVGRPVKLSDELIERRARSKTKFILAHPPPLARSMQRLTSRPRMILQLQLVADDSRPMPAFDLMYSASSLLTRSVPRLMKGENTVGTDTLVLFRSDMYGKRSPADNDTTTDVAGDEPTTQQPECLGTIACGKRAKDGSTSQGEICLESGLAWEAFRLKAGVYEFSGKNHDGLRVRWVLRKDGRKSTNQELLTESSTSASVPRFTFSIINPNTRLHPVIATLTGDNKLTILDQIPGVLSSALSSPPTSAPQSPLLSEFSSETSCCDNLDNGVSSYQVTDEALKTLIILTGIWVMSKEGWSEALSKHLEVMKKPRHDSTNGLSGNAVSATELTQERLLMSRHVQFRPQRSSTSSVSQVTDHPPSDSCTPANSTQASGTRGPSVALPQSMQRRKPQLPAGLCFGQKDSKRSKSKISASTYQSTLGVDSGNRSGVANRDTTAPLMHAEEASERSAEVGAPLPREMTVSRGSIDSDPVSEKPERHRKGLYRKGRRKYTCWL
jgi:hypothetical protein